MDRRTENRLIGGLSAVAVAGLIVMIAGLAIALTSSDSGTTQSLAATTQPRRPDGLYDTGLAPYSSMLYAFDNQWQDHLDGNIVFVYAGETGYMDRDPGRGVLVMQSNVSGLGGSFSAPVHVGSLHIVSYQGTLLTIQATTGEIFYFDAETRAFSDANGNPVPTDSPTPTVMSASSWSVGIVDSGQAPVAGMSYDGVNSWSWDLDGNHVVVYAGRKGPEAPNPGRGTIGVLAETLSLHPIPSLSGWYDAPPGVGALRVTSYEGTLLTIEAITGETFYFDAETRAFTDTNGSPVPTDTPTPGPAKPTYAVGAPWPEGATPSPAPRPAGQPLAIPTHAPAPQ